MIHPKTATANTIKMKQPKNAKAPRPYAPQLRPLPNTEWINPAMAAAINEIKSKIAAFESLVRIAF
ncbi:hypothetical protein M0Q28_06225 [Patescibacteria group bacterium]|jgi:hypothetical protein|nr:hypothetical protein [Patescibacteria group bacterium]